MNRFCDHIRIYRKKGNIYDPFATPTTETEKDPNGIYQELVYEGECKGEDISQTAMLSVADRGNFRIFINSTDVDADNRDIAYFQTNGEGQEILLTILNVKRYEKETVIRAMHLKDGTN